MAQWASARLEDIEEISDGRVPWRPVRHRLGIAAFGLNAFTGREVGDRIINEHDESGEQDGHEEVYFVHSGRARFEIDGETVDAAPGTFVFVQPAATRTAFAEEPNTTLVAVGAAPGKVYVAHGWESWMPLVPLYEAGEYEQVYAKLSELIADDPPYGLLHYNAACMASVTGRKQEAIAHLRRAIELFGDFRGYAEKDSELDGIREEPGFRELVEA